MLRTEKSFKHLNLADFFSPIPGWAGRTVIDGGLDWVETAVDYTFFSKSNLDFSIILIKKDWEIEFLDLIYLYFDTKHVLFG